MSRTIHDVKATDVGGRHVRFKAEVDFDGREIARFYLEQQDLEKMLQVSNQLYMFTVLREFEHFSQELLYLETICSNVIHSCLSYLNVRLYALKPGNNSN